MIVQSFFFSYISKFSLKCFLLPSYFYHVHLRFFSLLLYLNFHCICLRFIFFFTLFLFFTIVFCLFSLIFVRFFHLSSPVFSSPSSSFKLSNNIEHLLFNFFPKDRFFFTYWWFFCRKTFSKLRTKHCDIENVREWFFFYPIAYFQVLVGDMYFIIYINKSIIVINITLCCLSKPWRRNSQ